MNFLNSKYPFNSPLTFLSLTLLANCIGGFVFANSAQAQSFTLDFGSAATGFNSGNVTLGDSLDANLLDGAGQTIGGTPFSTSDGNIGNIFNPIGINITSSTNTVGLFNSVCTPFAPSGAVNNSAPSGAPICEPGGGNNGDDDLATGNITNSSGGQLFNTTPQGNLLIIEEGAGDGVPDDNGSGTLTLDFTQGSVLENVNLESITFVDDVRATVTVNFDDMTSESTVIDFRIPFDPGNNQTPVTSGVGTLENSAEFVDGENAVGVIGGFDQMKNVDSLAIAFNSSGGIGEIAFSDFQPVPFEFSPGLGLLLSGLGFLGLKISKGKKSANKLEL